MILFIELGRGCDVMDGGRWGIGLMGRKRGREVCCGSYILRDPQMASSEFSN